jgi:hypothetical protein
MSKDRDINTTLDHQGGSGRSEVFADPVGYLRAFGIESELVAVSITLPTAA